MTGNVTAAVENLANDAERLLEFVGNDVVESLGGFAEMANSYNSDAANVDSHCNRFLSVIGAAARHPLTE